MFLSDVELEVDYARPCRSYSELQSERGGGQRSVVVVVIAVGMFDHHIRRQQAWAAVNKSASEVGSPGDVYIYLYLGSSPELARNDSHTDRTKPSQRTAREAILCNARDVLLAVDLDG